MEDLGNRLRSLRQERKWTQGDIAEQLKITVAAFSKIEKQVTDISLSRLKQLSAIFGISLAELLGFAADGSSAEPSEEVRQLREANEKLSAKVTHLQEYIITLYEELHKTKLNLKSE